MDKQGHKSKVAYVEARDILVDDEIQRTLTRVRVARIARDMDLDALGMITVNLRENGKYYIIDGQHRIAALTAIGLAEWKCKCEVFTHLSRKEEADLFIKRNYQKIPSAYDTYHAGLVAQDPTALVLRDTAQSVGLRISNTSSEVNGVIRCVSAMRRIGQMNGGTDLLHDTLTIATDAWGRIPMAVEGRVVEGIAIALYHYNTEINRPALVRKLAKFPGGPAGLLGAARGLMVSRSASVARCLASIVVATYNKGRRSGTLADL